MAKKRKCRLTAEEQAIHAEAVRLRRMTDAQLVEQFHRASETGTPVGGSGVPQKCPEAATPIGNTSAVEMLLTALSEGKCKGIKSGIAYKVEQLAREMELVR